jgi:hypothetical protein
MALFTLKVSKSSKWLRCTVPQRPSKQSIVRVQDKLIFLQKLIHFEHVQGIFTRRLRKRIDANTLLSGQTNGRTNSQAEYNAVPKMARAPQLQIN